jgi:hypothetical protein
MGSAVTVGRSAPSGQSILRRGQPVDPRIACRWVEHRHVHLPSKTVYGALIVSYPHCWRCPAATATQPGPAP